METLILASCSPRRSELLTIAGIPFFTVSPDVDESCDLPAARLSLSVYCTRDDSFLPRIPWSRLAEFRLANLRIPKMPYVCSGSFPAVPIRYIQVFQSSLLPVR